MAVKLSPYGNEQILDDSGNLASGWKLYWYAAGSTTPQNTYTDSTGGTPQANPIILNARGETASPIWLTTGLSYKCVVKDSSDVTKRTIDNITGVNDSSTSTDQWTDSGLTPTYVSTTSFTLSGDQTSNFHVGRRLKFTVTAGTVYGRITASAYAALTTVTVQMDGTQVLDSGLSAVFLSILTANVLSLPVRAATAAGTDTYTCTMGMTRYVKDDEYQVYFTNANATTTPTLNSDGLGAKTIKTQSGGALAAGQLSGACTLRYDGTDLLLLNPLASAVSYQQGYLFGATLSNNGVDAVNDIDVTAGKCRDSTDTENMNLSAITKQLDAAWAVGTNQGMRDTGAISNGTWHIFIIKRTDTGVVDVLASLSPTAPTMPTNYTKFRRIGSIIRSGGTILGFKQSGDLFRLNDAPAVDFTTANPGTSAVTWTIGGCPTGIVVEALVRFGYNNNNTYAAVALSPLDSTDQAPSNTATPLGDGAHYGTASANTMLLWAQIKTNTSAQIRYRVSFSSASTTAYGVGYGWRDDRGRSA